MKYERPSPHTKTELAYFRASCATSISFLVASCGLTSAFLASEAPIGWRLAAGCGVPALAFVSIFQMITMYHEAKMSQEAEEDFDYE